MAKRHVIETRLTATDKTKAAFNRVQKRMKSLKKASLVAGAGVAAVAAAFVVAARRAVNFGDNIAKTANKLGIGTKAFQEMRLATDLAGVSSGQFESALGAMSKRIGELRLGTGTLFTVMQKLNDDAFRKQILSTKDNAEAFRLFIGRIASLENAQDRAALSAAAFGRTAGIALSKLSLEELDKGVAIAREFGIAIDENLLREAEKLKDAFTIAASVFQKQFFSELLRAMKSIDLKEFAINMAKLASGAVRAAMGLGKLFGVISESRVEVLETQIARLTENIEINERKIAKWAAGNSKATTTIEDMKKRVVGYLITLKLLKAELKALKPRPMPPVKDTGFFPDPDARHRPKPPKSDAEQKKIKSLLAALGAYRNKIQATGVALLDLTNQKFKTIEALDTYKRELEITSAVEAKINGLRVKGLEITKEVESSIINEAIANDRLNESLQRIRESLEPGPIQQYMNSVKSLRISLEEVAVRGADSLTDSLQAMVNGTQSAKEAFKSMASSIISDLQRMIIKKYIVDRIFGFVSGALGGGVGGGGGGGLPAAGPGPMAKGGPVAGGRPYLVGERGPELMVPRRSGQIIPNDKLGGGGLSVVNNYDFSGANPATLTALRQEAERIKQDTFSAVFSEINRGGSYARMSGRR